MDIDVVDYRSLSYMRWIIWENGLYFYL